jgi:hypothetical protein
VVKHLVEKGAQLDARDWVRIDINKMLPILHLSGCDAIAVQL